MSRMLESSSRNRSALNCSSSRQVGRWQAGTGDAQGRARGRQTEGAAEAKGCCNCAAVVSGGSSSNNIQNIGGKQGNGQGHAEHPPPTWKSAWNSCCTSRVCALQR